MRIQINNQILDSIKQKLIRKLNLSPETIARMNQGSTSLYVENLKETKDALMQSRVNEIAIDKKFVLLDEKGNFIDFVPEYKKIVYSQLGHELLHAASRINLHSGIKSTKNINCTGLNEGITQMFTEDAFGYVVSTFTDRYNSYKKIAKLMRLCLGNEVFKSSYFNQTDALEIACNKLAGTDLYNEINQLLTDINLLKSKASLADKSQLYLYKEIYEKRLKACFSNIITYLIVPKLKTLKTETEQKEFIKQVLIEVSDDQEIKRQVIDLLNKELFMSQEELKKEQQQVKEFDDFQKEKERIIEGFRKDSIPIHAFFTDSEGNISYRKENGKTIEISPDNDICILVYNALYKHYFSKDFDVENYVKTEILPSGKIEFPPSLSLTKRKILLAKVKLIASQNDYQVLTDFNEVSKDNILYLKIVNTKLEFNDLPTLLDKYELKSSNGSLSGKCIVVNKNTGREVMDSNISIGVKFANLWLSTYEHLYSGEEIPGLTDAFSETNLALYNEIIDYAVNNISRTGKIDLKKLERYAENHSNSRMIKIVRTILGNPDAYEWTYKYIQSKAIESLLQTEKEKSFIEEDYRNYSISTIESEVEDIFKGKK